MVTNQKTIISKKLDVKPFDFYNKIDYHTPTNKNYDVKLFKYYELCLQTKKLTQ